MVSFVECVRKTVRWYHKLFIHLLDVTLLYSYILMLKHSGRRPTSLREFTYSVASTLLEKYGQPEVARIPGRRPSLPRDTPFRLACSVWAQQYTLQPIPPTPSEVDRSVGRKVCYICKHTSRRPQKKSVLLSVCKACDVPLCPGQCFTDYHLQQVI